MPVRGEGVLAVTAQPELPTISDTRWCVLGSNTLFCHMVAHLIRDSRVLKIIYDAHDKSWSWNSGLGMVLDYSRWF